MKLELTKEERKEMLISAFANGGLSSLYNCSLEYNPIKSFHKVFKKEGDCFEDTLCNLLEQDMPLVFDDEEGDEEVTITNEKIDLVLANMNKDYLVNMANLLTGNDDATDGFNILQLFMYNEVIYG